MFLNKNEIKLVFNTGRTYFYNNLFKIIYCLGHRTKIAIIIFKKYFKKAVVRNKIKRRILNSLIINKIFKRGLNLFLIFIYISKKNIGYNILNYYIRNFINNEKIFNYRTRKSREKISSNTA